jgi:protein-tyrosine phosphatase
MIRRHSFLLSMACAIALAFSGCATAPLQSPTAAADSALQAPRLIALEGAQNFRDIGGYRTANGRRVKWGMIFRSADLSKLTGSDLKSLNGLGIQTVYDLRSTGERRTAPDAFKGGSATVSLEYDNNSQAIQAALRSNPTPELLRSAFRTTYPTLLVTLQPEYHQLFDGLLEGKGATLYHCSAGKDRTGIATALILSALGVPRETIIADFLMSNRYYHPAANASPMGALAPELSAVLQGVDESYLRTTFDVIDAQYGSVEGYFERALGVDKAKIARLRKLYTE